MSGQLKIPLLQKTHTYRLTTLDSKTFTKPKTTSTNVPKTLKNQSQTSKLSTQHFWNPKPPRIEKAQKQPQITPHNTHTRMQRWTTRSEPKTLKNKNQTPKPSTKDLKTFQTFQYNYKPVPMYQPHPREPKTSKYKNNSEPLLKYQQYYLESKTSKNNPKPLPFVSKPFFELRYNKKKTSNHSPISSTP